MILKKKYSFSWPIKKQKRIYYSLEVISLFGENIGDLRNIRFITISSGKKVNNFATDRNLNFYRISTEEQ